MTLRTDTHRCARGLLLGALLALALGAPPASAATPTGTWNVTGSLTRGLGGTPAATALPDGRSLLAGDANTQVYDPASGTWSSGGCLGDRRLNPLAITLKDGRILLAGGTCGTVVQTATPSAEIYDAATGTFVGTGPMLLPRSGFAGALLKDGRVLVVSAGNGNPSGGLTAAEVYDPAATDPATGIKGTWTATGSLSVPVRAGVTLTTLADGRVLIVGGESNGPFTTNNTELYDPATGKWTQTGKPATSRKNHVAALLPSGKVLIAGGQHVEPDFATTNLDSAELYDPATGTWSATGSLSTQRNNAPGTSIAGGKVLMVGGRGDSGTVFTAEVYDPATGAWTLTPTSPTRSHQGTQITVLPNGRVMVAAGQSELYDPVAGTWSLAATPKFIPSSISALPDGKVLGRGSTGISDRAGEIYDPAANTWTDFGPRGFMRQAESATLLANGKVLIAGGFRANVTHAAAEIYDPASGLATETGAMGTARSYQTATRLANGKVLVAGGLGVGDVPLDSAELYDPAAGTWSAAGTLGARWGHTATLLPSGKVLVVGGKNESDSALDSSELYDPATNSWSAAGPVPGARTGHTATALADGRVLVAGGQAADGNPRASTELYALDGTWKDAPALADARSDHSATLLPGGTVLVTGGTGTGGSGLRSSELYDPLANAWAATDSLNTPRPTHRATLLGDGRVLAVGLSDTSAEVYDPAAPRRGSFLPTGAPRYPGWGSQDRLRNGKVLVAGGGDPAVRTELFNPLSERWSVAASMTDPLPGHQTLMLGDGRLLAAGGETTGAQIYDPVANAWSATGSMTALRSPFGLGLLGDGRALAVGDDDFVSKTAETFNPATGTWTPTVDTGVVRGRSASALGMSQPGCAATCGKVLVTGGVGSFDSQVLELYDPASNTFSSPGKGTNIGSNASLIRLPDGRVLITSSDSAEIYDPAQPDTVPTGRPAFTRSSAATTLLAGGDVLRVGGRVSGQVDTTPVAELWDHETGKWHFTGKLGTPRGGPYATGLAGGPYSACGRNCGKALITGGEGPGGVVLATAELFTPEPEITTLSASSGPVGGGTRITISGHGLAAVDRVTFGATQAASFVPDEEQPESKLTVIVPPHAAGNVDVRVESAGGVSDKSAATRFRYLADAAQRQLSPAGGQSPTAHDSTPPALSALRLSHRRFRAGSEPPHLARTAPVGTKIRFRLSEAATVTLSFTRVAPGRKVGHSCRAPSRRLSRKRRCTRLAVIKTKPHLAAKTGTNTARFAGRLDSTHMLRPGRYRMTISATDPAGNHSRPRRATFVLLGSGG